MNFRDFFQISLLVVALVGANFFTADADCPDQKIRPNSPCRTTLSTCAGITQNCRNTRDETTASGNFQCDIFQENSFCHGAGANSFVLCYGGCSCFNTTRNRQRVCLPDNRNCRNFTREQQTSALCVPVDRD